MTTDVLFFEVRGRRCAIAVASVREVVIAAGPTPVPLAPAVIRGVAPIHGQVLPVLDLGVYWGTQREGRPDSSFVRTGRDRVLVIEIPARAELAPVRAALAVDRVTHLAAVDEGQCRPAPPMPTFITATVVDATGLAWLVDAGRLFDHVRGSLQEVST